MNTNTENLSRTFYFGLSVEVVHRMESCSWVRFSGHDLTVDTDDLAPVQRIQPGLATSTFSDPPSNPVRCLHARVG
jgi:hypothetical protein